MKHLRTLVNGDEADLVSNSVARAHPCIQASWLVPESSVGDNLFFSFVHTIQQKAPSFDSVAGSMSSNNVRHLAFTNLSIEIA